jgi:hypothetical protein
MKPTNYPEPDEYVKPFNPGIFTLCIVIVCCVIVPIFGFILIDKLEDEQPLTPTCNRIELELDYPKPDTLHLERATTYQPTIAQCDSDPLTTADGSKINPDSLQRWVALSRDLLTRWGGQFSFGDTITTYSKTHPQVNGDWVVHDCMNAKYKMSIDFLADFDEKLGVGKDVKIIYCGE